MGWIDWFCNAAWERLAPGLRISDRDATIVRAYQHAAWAKEDQGRSRDGLSTKINMAVRGLGVPCGSRWPQVRRAMHRKLVTCHRIFTQRQLESRGYRSETERMEHHRVPSGKCRFYENRHGKARGAWRSLTTAGGGFSHARWQVWIARDHSRRWRAASLSRTEAAQSKRS